MKKLSGVAWAFAPLPGPGWRLHPDEEQFVAQARERRRAEFSAGRHLARRLAKSLGRSIACLPRGADGAPAWPKGVLASISHCEDLCVVAMARDDRLRALGIDVEPNRAIDRDLWPELFTPLEQDWLGRDWLDRDPSLGVDCSRFAFSAKEAYYKAFNPEEVSSFLDLEIRESGDGFSVSAASQPRPHRLEARRLGPWLITVCSAAAER